nr:hypothetical transcript [Hymenolepis microstoma]
MGNLTPPAVLAGGCSVSFSRHSPRLMAHGLADQHFNSHEEVKNWISSWILSKDEKLLFAAVFACCPRDGSKWYLCNSLGNPESLSKLGERIIEISEHKSRITSVPIRYKHTMTGKETIIPSVTSMCPIVLRPLISGFERHSMYQNPNRGEGVPGLH